LGVKVNEFTREVDEVAEERTNSTFVRASEGFICDVSHGAWTFCGVLVCHVLFCLSKAVDSDGLLFGASDGP
jgi:hypothetical protein